MQLGPVLNLILLVLGFGFVIFWHELGHFLAARIVGVRVEQFAVGMGHAIFSFRRGLGFRAGSTREEYELKTNDVLAKQKAIPAEGAEFSEYQRGEAAKSIGIGETEYRLSWVPIGGYVRPTGQDDLRPASAVTHDDPHSYAAKSVGARMFIISAGVVMNIILALALFALLFRIGFDTPANVVGDVQAGSPAARAGVMTGDRILSIDGSTITDFTKIPTAIALAGDGNTLKVVVDRPTAAGKPERKTLNVLPEHAKTNSGLLTIGVSPSAMLVGEKYDSVDDAELDDSQLKLIGDGETITAVNGQPIADAVNDYWRLDRAVQSSDGSPVTLTIKSKDGHSTRDVSFTPILRPTVGDEGVAFAGMEPRVRVAAIQATSPAKGTLKIGDVILNVISSATRDGLTDVSLDSFRTHLNSIGEAGAKAEITVLRDGGEVKLAPISPNQKVNDGKKGLGIVPMPDEANAVVGGVTPSSAAARAGIPVGAKLLSISGDAVKTWTDVRRVLMKQPLGNVAVSAEVDGVAKTFALPYEKADAEIVSAMRYAHSLPLKDLIEKRQTSNLVTAARWGLIETRGKIAEVYLTLRRVFTGSVPASNLVGPVGIVHAGTKLAYKGTDWLIFYLALISANLAVVNFLPMPVVDGGLFLFLIIEKITGRPLSAKAQTAAQLVGIAMILCVFLFATYNDLSRMFG